MFFAEINMLLEFFNGYGFTIAAVPNRYLWSLGFSVKDPIDF